MCLEGWLAIVVNIHGRNRPGYLTGEALPQTSRRGDQTADPDGASSAESLVHGLGEPAADERAAEIRGAVDESKKPGVTRRVRVGNPEGLLVKGLCTVDDGLVHTLDGSAECLEVAGLSGDVETNKNSV